LDVETLVTGVRAGDTRALARALTLVESRSPDARRITAELFADERSSKLVGLTGPPGVGKSTLADAIGKVARARGHEVAILAIDPTSPFTGGALLGDRARMDASAEDPGIFVRSMATRGHVGGLAAAAFEAMILLEAAGKDFIVVETVGAGQDEIEVAAAVDVTVVVLAPGLGDVIQASKAGLMEIADVLAVNKADREGAGLVAEELHVLGNGVPVHRTVALDGTGVAGLVDRILEVEGERHLLDAWLHNALQSLVRDRIPAERWKEVVARIEAHELSPYEAAERLLESLRL